MRTQIGTLVLAGIVAMASLAAPAMAQTGAAVVEKAPGAARASRTVEVTATITAIDAKTREVTLKGPQGNEVTLTAGAQVKKFDQLKVGDQVHVKYVEALALELKKGSTAAVSRVEESAAAGTKPGKAPGGLVGRQVTIVAEVVALDAARQTVTLRGPQRTVELDVADPVQFKLLAIGDRVQAKYTQALAMAVEPVNPAPAAQEPAKKQPAKKNEAKKDETKK